MLLLISFGVSGVSAQSARTNVQDSNSLDGICWKIYVLATRSHGEDGKASADISKIILSTKSPTILHGITIWSLKQMRSHGCDGICRICDRYEHVSLTAVPALAQCEGDEAARLLVALLNDFSGSAHGTEVLYEAILHRGRPTLPYLDLLSHKNPVAKDCINAILMENR